FEDCRDVLIENVQFKDSPHHMLKALGSRDVKIQGISIEQGIYEDDGPNTDGLAVSGFNIRISDCNFTTGDDCLVIGGAEHLTLNNCTFSTTESAIVLSGLKNGVISNCSMFDAGSAINIRPGRGRLVENVTISNLNYILKKSEGGNLLFVRSKPYGEVRWSVRSWAETWNIDVKPPTGPPPVIRNILISNIIANSDGAIFLDGQEDGYIEDITFDNIRYTMRGGREKPESANPSHPFYVFGHHTAPYGIFCRFVKDITLRNIKFTWNQPEKSEWGSPIRFENAENIEIDRFEGRQSLGSDKPVIGLKNVNHAYIHDCQAAEGAGTFLEVGEGSQDILFKNNDLRRASKTLSILEDVDSDEIIDNGNIK
ncbi:MAG: right-handed parallel beta-helix repeat-containing protein, partial [Melioribacteraceae bacterium]|nr:right-handed parallel beta-helix repeat-containing protein [Melioribacteraceae bacterium]